MIHRNTFYNHFEDKYDLLRKFFNDIFKKRISQKQLKLLKTRPFYMLAKSIIEPYNDMFKMQRSEIFIDTFTKGFSNFCINKTGINQIAWIFGNIMSVVFWNDYYNWHYDMIKDYNKLDKIFITKKFPKIRD